MDVVELAVLMGMDSSDLSCEETARLQLYLDGGIDYINQYFEANDCDIRVSADNISAGFKLALKQYAEITDTVANVQSENVGGLSLTYSSNASSADGGLYASLNNYLDLFCVRKVKFIPFPKKR